METLESAFRQARGSLGWASFEVSESDPEKLRRALAPFGSLVVPRPGLGVIHRLTPSDRNKARRGTLSAVHGEGAFPAHVDGAHRAIPPRLVVIWCAEDDQRRPTILYHWRDIESHVPDAELLYHELFLFRAGRRSFVDSIRSDQRNFIRYDPGCMAPGTRMAKDVLEKVGTAIEEADRIEISWRAGVGIIIDNWRLLHARSGSYTAGSRVLWRAWLDDRNE